MNPLGYLLTGFFISIASVLVTDSLAALRNSKDKHQNRLYELMILISETEVISFKLARLAKIALDHSDDRVPFEKFEDSLETYLSTYDELNKKVNFIYAVIRLYHRDLSPYVVNINKAIKNKFKIPDTEGKDSEEIIEELGAQLEKQDARELKDAIELLYEKVEIKNNELNDGFVLFYTKKIKSRLSKNDTI